MISASLRQLEYFVAAVDTGTVTGAAARCSASQAAVSAGLNDLEAALGMQVLVRRPAKGVALTPGGERMLPIARRMLADAEDLHSLADAEQGRVSGRLRIACTVALSPRVLPTIAEEFARRHPDVRLEFSDGLAAEVQGLVLSGAADVCLLYRRQLLLGLDTRDVCEVHPYAVLPLDHPWANEPDVPLAALEEEQLIIVRAAESSRVMESMIEEVGVSPHAGWAFSNPETVRSMVARGLGYSLFSGKPIGVETFDGRRVAYVRVRDAVEPNRIVLAVQHGQRPTARLDALISLLAEPAVQAAFG